jgi:aminoglycoside 6'-N-acetyltransferase I
MILKEAAMEEAETVANLAIQMWEDNSIEELTEEFRDYIKSENGVVFLAVLDGEAVGFAQCGVRHDYVEGTDTSPVGYLEGIFVVEEYRRRGLAKDMLLACEKWAKEQGCTEFASDCELENEDSLRFHLKMGFKEANRIICFAKNL